MGLRAPLSSFLSWRSNFWLRGHAFGVTAKMRKEGNTTCMGNLSLRHSEAVTPPSSEGGKRGSGLGPLWEAGRKACAQWALGQSPKRPEVGSFTSGGCGSARRDDKAEGAAGGEAAWGRDAHPHERIDKPHPATYTVPDRSSRYGMRFCSTEPVYLFFACTA